MKTLKKTDFLIPFAQSDKIISVIVKGRKINIEGINEHGQLKKVVCYLHKSYPNQTYWVISHFESGLHICERLTKKATLQNAREIISKKIDVIEERAKEEFQKLGWVYPLNHLKNH